MAIRPTEAGQARFPSGSQGLAHCGRGRIPATQIVEGPNTLRQPNCRATASNTAPSCSSRRGHNRGEPFLRLQLLQGGAHRQREEVPRKLLGELENFNRLTTHLGQLPPLSDLGSREPPSPRAEIVSLAAPPATRGLLLLLSGRTLGGAPGKLLLELSRDPLLHARVHKHPPIGAVAAHEE